MAGTPPTNSAPPGRRAKPSAAGGRPTPVLVPMDVLAGQPDVPLNRDVTTVGSSDTCRLVLQSRTVSRHHAVFLVDGGTTFVADLASRTGVIVNGKLVREAELKAGDRVQIGKFAFRYRSADGAPAGPVPVAPAASAVVTGLLAIPLPGRVALVGRRETSDVALIGDPAVSAAHAALFHAGGQWYVRDLGSRTGTTVNSQAVIQRAIAFGDHIGIGAATIHFQAADAVPGHAPVVPSVATLSDGPTALPPVDLEPIQLSPQDLAGPGEADRSATPPPVAPFGLVAAVAHPVDVGLTATEPVDVSMPLASEPTPPVLEPSKSPPLPQPRSWDALDHFDLSPALSPAEAPADPPQPQPKPWDAESPADERAEPVLVPESQAAQPPLTEPTSWDADHPLADPAGPVPADAVVPVAPSFEPVFLADEPPVAAFRPEPPPWEFEPTSGGPAESSPAGDVLPWPELAEPTPDEIPTLATPASVGASEESVVAEPPPQVEPWDLDRPAAGSEERIATEGAAASALPELAKPTSDEVPVLTQAAPESGGSTGEAAAAEPPPPAASWDAEAAAAGLPEPIVVGVIDLPPPADTDSEAWDAAAVLDAVPDHAAVADGVAHSEPSPDLVPAWDAVVAEAPAVEPPQPAVAAMTDDGLSDVKPALSAAEADGGEQRPHGAEALAERPADDGGPPAPSGVVAGISTAGQPVADLLGHVEDFVFVPGDAAVAPDEMFWGEPDGDPVAPPDRVAIEPPLDASATINTAPAGPVEVTSTADLPQPSAHPVEVAATVAVASPEPIGGQAGDALFAPVDVPSATDTSAEWAAEPPLNAAAAIDVEPVEPIEVTSMAEWPEPSAQAESPEPTGGGAGDGFFTPGDLRSTADGPAEPAAEQLPTEGLDPSLAVTTADAAVTAEPAPVATIAVDEPLADPPTAAGEFAAHDQAAVVVPPFDTAPVEPMEFGGASPDLMPAADALAPSAPGYDAALPGLADDAWTAGPTVLPVAPEAEAVSFEDLLADLAEDGPPAGAGAAVGGDAPTLDAELAAAETTVPPSAESHTAGVPTDEPIGFELDLTEDDADWGDLDLLDLDAPAEPPVDWADRVAEPADVVPGVDHAEVAEAVSIDAPIEPEITPAVAVVAEDVTAGDADDDGSDVNSVDAAAETATAAAAAAAGGLAAVVNLSDALVAGAAVSATEALTPVVDFAAVAGGAAVDSFTAVADTVLTESPAAVAGQLPPVAADAEPASAAVDEDDLAFLDFDAPLDEPIGGVTEEPPAVAVELAETAVPIEPPEWVETVTEPVVDVAPTQPQLLASWTVPPEPEPAGTVTEPIADVAQPEPQLLASVTIPPPPEEPATGGPPAMSGPSLFGFNFEGGSFLGGMPLPLHGAPAPLPEGGITFDMPQRQAVEASEGAEQDPPRVRPATPPAPLGLIGLVSGTAATTAEPPSFVAPAGLVDGSAGVRMPPPPPPPTLSAPVPGSGRPRSGDVFSQMAGPIGVVEAFGARPGRIDQYQIPEVDRSAAPGIPTGDRREAAVTAGLVPPTLAHRLSNDERLIPADLPKRIKVRRLMVALVVVPALWTTGVYCSMSKTATVVGTLRFSGLSAQSDSARRLFHGDQVARLCGDEVRDVARRTLLDRGRPTGPTDDGIAMGRAMQDQISCTWDANDLKLTYKAADADNGKAQVEALLSALRVTDESLGDARARAAHELDASNADYAAAKSADDDIKAQRREQTSLAQDRPDKGTVDALDRAADSAGRKLDSVRAELAAAEASLDGWQKQDPTKPIDPAIDPEMTNLRRQLTPIQAQIAKAKQLATLNGDGGSGGAPEDDPLLVVLQQQADRLQARLDRRAAELARDQAVPQEQRARQREAAIESLSVQVAGLKHDDADDAAAAAAATAAAVDAHAKVDAAHLAEAKAADLYTKLMDADQALRQAGDDLSEKQHAMDATVVVDGSASTNPDVSVLAESDPRPVVAIVGSLVIGAAIFFWLLAVAGTGEDVVGFGPGDDGSGSEPADGPPGEPAESDQQHPVGA